MDNPELIVPTRSSHWSLRLVETKKPFPNHILANVTYKIIRFFYPPFALEAVDLTHVVSNPEVNAFNVGLFLSFSLFLPCVVYAGWKYFQEARPAVPKWTDPLLEQQERKNTPEPQLAGSLDQSDKTTNVLMEPKWLIESKTSFIDAQDGDKRDDLADQIDRAVWERPIAKKQQNP
ncbi:hypothetical protein KR054_002285 [Drosophila jambulina]|nr:hypothetical protein KR054_002285 [Drosophila jambulina]